MIDLLINNGTVVTFEHDTEMIEEGAVLIRDGLIKDVGKSDRLEKEFPKEERLDAEGKLIMPGMICAHTHFYSAFATGMDLDGKAPKDFEEILEKIWWRLDKALNPEDIYQSAMVGAVNAIKSGTTCVIDHHASPSSIEGSLDRIARAVEETGLRACLCYEVTDRNGKEDGVKGIQENIEFAEDLNSSYDSEKITSMMGLHASFTLSDETILEAKKKADGLDLGFHLHLAEGKEDVKDAEDRHGVGVAERLSDLGILNDKTLGIHGIHLDESGLDIVEKTNTNIIHCPESNMNNGVGVAPVEEMLSRGISVGLGTDGMSFDMFREMRQAYLVHKLHKRDPRVISPEDLIQIQVHNNSKIAKKLFSGSLGKIKEGAVADIILVDYEPKTPMNEENFPAHLIFGIDSEDVDTTIIDGQVLMRKRELIGLDEDEIAAKSRELAEKVWRRI